MNERRWGRAFSYFVFACLLCTLRGAAYAQDASLADAGVTIFSEQYNSLFGYGVSDAGDVNGDGVNDYFVTAQEANSHGRSQNGRAYLIYGNCAAPPTEIDLLSLSAGQGTLFSGDNGADKVGSATSHVGDLDGDGNSEFAIAASNAKVSGRSSAGIVYLFNGKPAWPSTSDFDLENFASADGTKIIGVQGKRLGRSLSHADFNGDGVQDLVIGAEKRAYVIFGSDSLPAQIDLAGPLGGVGMIFEGAAEETGYRVAGLGDVDGDGYDDIAITAARSNTHGSRSGAAYIIFGEASPPTSVNLDALDSAAVDSIVVVGALPGDQLGSAVGNAGDFNHDGFQDIVIGAMLANRNGNAEVGEAYLIFGAANLRDLNTGCDGASPCSEIDAGDLGALGITFRGSYAHHRLGHAVDGIGDFNSDGIDDLVIGASGATASGLSSAGAAYVLFGGQPLDSLVTGTDFENATDRYLGEENSDLAGFAVAGVGDVNCDGAPDFLTSAIKADTPTHDNAGQAYVVFGEFYPGLEDLACTVTGTRVTFSWELYEKTIYDSIEVREGDTLIATLAGSATGYEIRRVTAGSHTYTIVGIVEDSSNSVECTVAVTVAPPSGLLCQSTGEQVQMLWTNGQNYTTALEVYMDGALIATLPPGTHSYNSGIPEPGTYEYCVRGVNGSDPSSDTCCTVVVPQPVYSLNCEVDGNTVLLTWLNAEPYDLIKIFRDGVSIAIRPGDDTDFNDLGVPPGPHVYVVRSAIGDDRSEAAECEVLVGEAVTDLTCEAVNDSVFLTWTNGGAYTSVHIARDGSEIAELPGSAGSYEDAGVEPGTHTYEVTGDASGALSQGAECELHVIEPVAGLSCAGSGNDVLLNWTSNPDAGYSSIKIFRDGVEIAELSGDASAYSDLDLGAGAYEYAVVAMVVNGSTSSANAECQVTVIESPAGLTCSASGTTIELSWTANLSYTNVHVYRDGGLIATLPGSAHGYSDATSAGTHFYEVVGIAGSSESLAATCEVISAGDPFALECSLEDGLLTLSWQNGGAYDEVHVSVDGTVVLELPGGTEQTEITLSTSGTHTVCVSGVIGTSSSNPTCCVVFALEPVEALHCFTSGSSVFLQWTNGEPYQAIEITRDGELVATIPGGSTSYADVGVDGGSHTYEVRGVSGDDSSAPVSCEVTVLEDIADLTCSADDGVVSLHFTPPSGLTSIKIFRNNLLIAVLPGDTTEYEDTGVSAGVYDYIVLGVIPGGSTARATCRLHIPLQPFGLFCTLVDGNTPVLGWENSEVADSIEVLRNGELIASLPGTTSSFTDEPLAAGEYDYELVSVIDPNQRSVHVHCTVIVLDPPENFTCLAVNGGVLLAWANADEYASLVILRDGAEIAAVPGSIDSFFDVFTDVGTHTYEIAGFRGGFLSAYVSCELIIPAPVSGLTCSFDLSTGELSWTNGGEYTSIRILRNGALIDELAGDATSYIDPILPAGHYEYSVIGVIDPNQGPAATCVIDVLLQPDDLLCNIEGTTALLSWVNGDSYENIEVFRDGELIATLEGADTSYTDSVSDPATYTYCIRGFIGSSVSGFACCHAQLIAGPLDLVCAVDGGSSHLSWTNGDEYDFIQIKRDGDLIVTLAGDATSFDALGLTPGAHNFQVIGHIGLDASESAVCDVVIVAPVEGLLCAADGDTVHLSWTLGGGSYDALSILRNGSEIAVLGGNAVSYDDSPLAAGAYEYQVVASESGNLAEAASCEVEVLVLIVGFQCSAAGSDVFLQWTNGQIYESIEITRDGLHLATVDGASNVYVDSDASAGSHEYVLIASSGGTNAAPVSCEVSVQNPISGLTCELDGSEITLSWTNGSAYDNIEIHRNGSLLATLAGGETSYVDAPPSGVYLYSLTGQGGGGESEATTCEVVAPGAPFGLSCVALDDDVSLSWSNGESYDQIEIRLDGALVQTLAGGTTNTVLHGVSAGDHEACVTGVIGGDASASACCTIVVPEPITGFECFSVGDDVHLSWSNGETYATIEILRDNALLAVIPGNLESYVDAGVSAGSHTYKISGTLGGGTTAAVSCTVSVLAPIGDVSCSAEEGGATIDFAAAGTYSSIRITRNGTLIATLSGTASSYSDDSLSPGTYEYCVTGVTGDNETTPECCTVEVPHSPFGLTCGVAGGDDVELNWQNAEAGDNISIERDGDEIVRLNGAVNTYTDLGVEPGVHEYCVINIVDGFHSVAACCTVTVPFPPIHLNCDSTPDGIALSWQNGQVYGGVQILRDGDVIAELSGATESFTDTNAGAGVHDYDVVGIAGGSASSSVSCSIDVADPVQGLTCENTGNGIALTWTVPSGLDQVQVYRNGALLATLSGSAHSYLDELSVPGDYSYEVFGIDNSEYSPAAECSVDVLGALEDLTCCATDGAVEICWTNSDTYNSIRVYRGGSLVATLSGSATCYDENRMTGTYNYEIVGISGAASSAAAACTVRVAGAITGFACELLQETCIESDALLTWNVSESFDSIEIYRDGNLISTVGGAVEEFTDSAAGAPHDYQLIGVLAGDLCGATSSTECATQNTLAEFLRGNSNNDHITNIADAVFTLNYMFLDGPTPACLDAADITDNGSVNLGDPVYTLMYLFQQGVPPPAPFPNEGVDQTCDSLDCGI